MSRYLGVACLVAGAVLGGSALVAALGPDEVTCTDPVRAAGREHSSATGHAGHRAGHHTGHHTGHDGHGAGHVMVGPTCNRVEMVAPAQSTYVPDLRAATRADRARARKLLHGVDEFCRTHTAAELMAEWTPGTDDPESPTHYFNPRRDSLGLDPANPRAALVYQGQLGGVMFTGIPLPRLGSIPRAHSHDMSRPREMVHVYCTDDLKDAFTPNRELGVLADTLTLRQRIRPRVAELADPGLRAVLLAVRASAAGAVPAGDPSLAPVVPGLDPRVWADRDEVRRSLMVLTEPQLRTVWRLIAAG